jgi:hypothetical protein
MAHDFKVMLKSALDTKITIKDSDRECRMTKLAVGVEQLVNQYAKGDRYARRDVFDLAHRFGIDLAGSLKLTAEPADEGTVSDDDEALLADYVRRASRRNPDEGEGAGGGGP